MAFEVLHMSYWNSLHNTQREQIYLARIYRRFPTIPLFNFRSHFHYNLISDITNRLVQRFISSQQHVQEYPPTVTVMKWISEIFIPIIDRS